MELSTTSTVLDSTRPTQRRATISTDRGPLATLRRVSSPATPSTPRWRRAMPRAGTRPRQHRSEPEQGRHVGARPRPPMGVQHLDVAGRHARLTKRCTRRRATGHDDADALHHSRSAAVARRHLDRGDPARRHGARRLVPVRGRRRTEAFTLETLRRQLAILSTAMERDGRTRPVVVCLVRVSRPWLRHCGA